MDKLERLAQMQVGEKVSLVCGCAGQVVENDIQLDESMKIRLVEHCDEHIYRLDFEHWYMEDEIEDVEDRDFRNWQKFAKEVQDGRT